MKFVIPIKYIERITDRQNPIQTMKTISIAIVEDIKEIAYNLQELFNDEEGMECKKVYHSAEDAITFLTKFPVDVVLCDIGLPGMDGIAAISKLYATCPLTQFCMFTVFEDNERIFDSLKAGAKGYILKNSDPTKIVESIKDLHNGGSPMNPEIARKVINAFAANKSISRVVSTELPLTKREFEILQVLSEGLLYKEIARELGITIGTVKQHVHKIYDKLQVNNKTEAINKYLKR